MPDARLVREWNQQQLTAVAAVALGEIWQTADGKAAVSLAVVGSANRANFESAGKYTVTKTLGITLLDGGQVFWDYSANSATFRKVGDRDFYLGRAVGDAGTADATVVVDLNSDPPYDLDLVRDPYTTAIVGTQALTGLALNRRGGALNIVLSSTSEAQKVDALGVNTFNKAANAIVELAFRVTNDGAGTVVDVNLGIASATHATDADSIANHLFLHLDANMTDLEFQSKDGTTTVAAVDSTTDYVEGAALANRVEVWFDLRNPADVQVYVDGVNVLPASVFDLSAAANEFKLLAHVEKTSAADVYEIDVDFMRARFAEQG